MEGVYYGLGMKGHASGARAVAETAIKLGLARDKYVP